MRFLRTTLFGVAFAALSLLACGSDDEAGAGPAPGDSCVNDSTCGSLKCCFADPADPVGVCATACLATGTGGATGSGGTAGAGGSGGVSRNTGGTGGVATGGSAGASGGAGTGGTSGSGGGGTGGSSGSGGGGTGGGGTGGGTSGIASHVVLSGSPTTNSAGCLDAGGAGKQPTVIVLNQTASGAGTLVISGKMSPIAGGVGLDPFALVQACGGGLLNGNLLEKCYYGRASFNALSGLGALGILDPALAEVVSSPWTPTAPSHDYVLTVTYNPATQTATVKLEIDGSTVGTLNTASLGAVGGNRLGLMIAQSTVCSLVYAAQ